MGGHSRRYQFSTARSLGAGASPRPSSSLTNSRTQLQVWAIKPAAKCLACRCYRHDKRSSRFCWYCQQKLAFKPACSPTQLLHTARLDKTLGWEIPATGPAEPRVGMEMTQILLIAGSWTALSLVAMPLMARLFRPHPACRAGAGLQCARNSGCAVSGQCLKALQGVELPSVAGTTRAKSVDVARFHDRRHGAEQDPDIE